MQANKKPLSILSYLYTSVQKGYTRGKQNCFQLEQNNPARRKKERKIPKKKLACALLASVLALTLTACGPGLLGSSRSSQSSTAQPQEPPANGTISAVDGYAEGRMGDVMQTYFFTYSINAASLCDTYEGYAPAEGNKLLVAEMTIKNTGRKSIEMYDTDFQAQWGDEEDFSLPITFNMETGEELEPVGANQLPGTYTLGVNEARTGLLVFEVPAGNRDLSISYMEYFSDDTTGDTFFVFFTASEPTAA